MYGMIHKAARAASEQADGSGLMLTANALPEQVAARLAPAALAGALEGRS
jgi:hypothetical protein